MYNEIKAENIMAIISVKNFSKSYKTYKKEPGLSGSLKSLFVRDYEDIWAVKDISFEITEGELIGFIGPNGAGKTTTLKCLSGLLYPTSGSISVMGFNPFERKYDYLSKISLVMGQKNQLWWDLPAIETFNLNKEIYNISDKDFNYNLKLLTNLLDVEDYLNIQVKKLSLGQRMKMELISALIHNPKILFLDEPTIGLDVVMQKNLRDFIKEYNKKFKATIILTSHYMKDVQTLCERIIMINKGKILFDGKLASLVQKYSGSKIFNLTLKKVIDPYILKDFGEIKKYEFPSLVLEINKKKANNLVGKIMKTLPIEDINISDQEIEDIIREIFENK